jgi:transcriptional regulator with XRE-family HTH domain
MEWRAAKEATCSDLAKFFGVSGNIMRQILSGQTRARPEMRKAFKELCGIPEEDWLLPEEKEQAKILNENLAELKRRKPEKLDHFDRLALLD